VCCIHGNIWSTPLQEAIYAWFKSNKEPQKAHIAIVLFSL
jgi:hypothetical protein